MFYQCSEFFPHPWTVDFALSAPLLRPWLRYKYCMLFHDLDLYEIGHC